MAVTDFFLLILVFVIGVLCWTPFINNVYGHDAAGAMYWVDRMRKKDLVFYKDAYLSPIGHLVHIIFMQIFWKKENTKAFYAIMSLYCALSSCLLFGVVSHLFSPAAAFFSSLLFSLYITSPRLDANWGPFEQLLPLPLVGGVLCILLYPEAGSPLLILLSGMLFGYAILIKQVALLYLPGFLLMVTGVCQPFFCHALFLLGMIVINAVPLSYYALRHQAFWEYLTCMWLHLLPSAIHPGKYNKFYPKNQVQGQKAKGSIREALLRNSRSMGPMLFLTFIGIVLLCIYQLSCIGLGLLACLLVSIGMIFMRGTFFPHYWLNVVPWLAIFAGFGFSQVLTSFTSEGRLTGVGLAAAACLGVLFSDAVRSDWKYYTFSRDPYAFLKRVWGEGVVRKYQKCRELGEYIKKITKPEDSILICGWEPSILMYSDRRHFTPEPCLYAEDYLDIYSRDNPSFFGFLNEIYRFKKWKIVKERENIFKKGYPEIIVFIQGPVTVEPFEKLTGMAYVLDQGAQGFPLFRISLELSELLSPYLKSSRLVQKETPEQSAAELRLKEMAKQNTEERLSFVKRLLKQSPYTIPYLLALGDSLIDSGKFDELHLFFLKLIRIGAFLQKDLLEILNKIGESHYIQGRWEEAEKAFDTVLARDPAHSKALNNLGVLFFAQSRNEAASQLFRRALDADPENQDARFNIHQLETV